MATVKNSQEWFSAAMRALRRKVLKKKKAKKKSRAAPTGPRRKPFVPGQQVIFKKRYRYYNDDFGCYNYIEAGTIWLFCHYSCNNSFIEPAQGIRRNKGDGRRYVSTKCLDHWYETKEKADYYDALMSIQDDLAA